MASLGYAFVFFFLLLQLSDLNGLKLANNIREDVRLANLAARKKDLKALHAQMTILENYHDGNCVVSGDSRYCLPCLHCEKRYVSPERLFMMTTVLPDEPDAVEKLLDFWKNPLDNEQPPSFFDLPDWNSRFRHLRSYFAKAPERKSPQDGVFGSLNFLASKAKEAVTDSVSSVGAKADAYAPNADSAKSRTFWVVFGFIALLILRGIWDSFKERIQVVHRSSLSIERPIITSADEFATMIGAIFFFFGSFSLATYQYGWNLRSLPIAIAMSMGFIVVRLTTLRTIRDKVDFTIIASGAVTVWSIFFVASSWIRDIDANQGCISKFFYGALETDIENHIMNVLYYTTFLVPIAGIVYFRARPEYKPTDVHDPWAKVESKIRESPSFSARFSGQADFFSLALISGNWLVQAPMAYLGSLSITGAYLTLLHLVARKNPLTPAQVKQMEGIWVPDFRKLSVATNRALKFHELVSSFFQALMGYRFLVGFIGYIPFAGSYLAKIILTSNITKYVAVFLGTAVMNSQPVQISYWMNFTPLVAQFFYAEDWFMCIPLCLLAYSRWVAYNTGTLRAPDMFNPDTVDHVYRVVREEFDLRLRGLAGPNSAESDPSGTRAAAQPRAALDSGQPDPPV